jgi:NAD(P)-dependent dehydrogenase (short-subunit alcohol dehydrogenase family)
VSTPIVGGGAAFNKEATDAALEKAQPLPIAGQPEDIAQAALYLASDASRFVTGHCLVVDGGATAGAIAGARAPRVSGIFAGPSFQQGGPALVR